MAWLWLSELGGLYALSVGVEDRDGGARNAGGGVVGDERGPLGLHERLCEERPHNIRETAGAVSITPWWPIRSSLSERRAWRVLGSRTSCTFRDTTSLRDWSERIP